LIEFRQQFWRLIEAAGFFVKKMFQQAANVISARLTMLDLLWPQKIAALT